jgi:hypothetical protein
MAKTAVGLEVGSSTCHLVALDHEGRMLRNMKFPTSEVKLISTVAGLPGEVHVHFEASELAGWVRSVFHGRVTRVVISHAKAKVLSQTLDEDEQNYHFPLSMQPRHKTAPLVIGAHSLWSSAAPCDWRA